MRASEHYLYKDAMREASKIREIEITVAFLTRVIVRWEATQFSSFIRDRDGKLEAIHQEESVVVLKVREEIQKWMSEIVERQYRLDDLLRRIQADVER